MCIILHLLHVAHVRMHARLTVSGSEICVPDTSSAMILSRKKTRHILWFAQLQSVVTI
jgi:hypothetical protein